MVETVEVAALPLAPRNPLPFLQQMKAAKSFHTGCEALRDAGGRVTRCSLAPTWMLPPVVVTTSPKGARDVLSRSYPFVDRAQPVFTEHRRLVIQFQTRSVAAPATGIATGVHQAARDAVRRAYGRGRRQAFACVG